MYKILIVDDEALTRKGLRYYFPWEDHGFTVYAEASNGKEALKICESDQPHVVITDIIMPVMDGFELINQIRERYKNVRCVAVSCLDKASDVQQMMLLGASGYFFKNDLNKDDIGRLLSRLSKEIKEINETNTTVSTLAIDEELWEPSCFFTIVLWSETQPSNPQSFKKLYIGFTEELIRRHVKHSQIINISEQGCILACDPDEKEYRVLHQDGHTIASLLMDETQNYFNQKSSICFYDLKLSWSNHVIASSLDMDYEINAIIHSLSTNDVVQTLKSFVSLHLKSGEIGIDNVKKAYIALLFEIDNILRIYSITLEKLLDADIFSLILHNNRRNFIFSIMVYVITQMLSFLSEKGNDTDKCIEKVIRYINAHFEHKINLVDAAAMAAMSPPYFCRLFKQHMGTSYIKYITGLRLEKAEMLLRNPSTGIQSIAERVGFENANYFSMVFKKVYGMPPTEFRQKIIDIAQKN